MNEKKTFNFNDYKEAVIKKKNINIQKDSTSSIAICDIIGAIKHKKYKDNEKKTIGIGSGCWRLIGKYNLNGTIINIVDDLKKEFKLI